ncbi:MAG: hypothetical protein ABR61_00080 [Actinobacteria bacterium BACL2 MAG-120813-bin23]|uniref:Uncharacterized protein n=1 Tax=Actinobacteria bacterium BACL2 MAG-120813-bin23 TaxID=1655569 RepID=A0A0R2Q928_9ACTN|nr:MAG: hypothetical protein ABR61_00080 [Actinobacteria bacterium BACL2 MAG-120813-bin23]
MSYFNLSDYEPVENRIRAFWLKYPNGRILTDLQRTERSDGRIEWICRSEAYTNSEDIRPQSTGFATEIEGPLQLIALMPVRIVRLQVLVAALLI